MKQLNLGPDVIRLLLPHRRPLLMVDRVVAYAPEAKRLVAERYVSANEEVFSGHFPGFQIWPGVFTQEGLGQSCNILLVLQRMQQAHEQRGGTTDEVLVALRNLERGNRLSPGFQRDLMSPLVTALPQRAAALIGLSASAQIKFTEPVFAGCRLEYHVWQTREFGEMVRFEVEALVNDRLVAAGTLTARTDLALPRLQDVA